MITMCELSVMEDTAQVTSTLVSLYMSFKQTMKIIIDVLSKI